ncbi:pyroglutamyl-peptidase I [Vibrio penaeicida]|uniref:Pyrrolidone-carboxylate peptidase n=1 Tax=Vibrio penaeicida TaxID=104609 RepID=A0AAV5NNH9_9VIBR|nr:pyroglutamyl-peptidase I [Vibrio penaeicida]RTZ20732.1 pyroglutamyl-peptidase I [Vibrio penaeicida]GLQ72174.1 pyrrolidone-carboxylate peptidase [Vibrio penaeicida]
MKTVLITGFEPFGGATINPALEAVKQLEGRELNKGRIVTCAVPVVRYESVDMVKQAIQAHNPDIVITVGQAAGRDAITPERVAINVDDFRIPDNGGLQPIDEPVVAEGPDAYFSTLPIKAICQVLNENGVPAKVSNTAGTYVCNHLFYGVQHFLSESNIRHGFVHIPLLPEQAEELKMPGMPLDTIVEGLALMAQVCIDHNQDIKVSEGTIC